MSTAACLIFGTAVLGTDRPCGHVRRVIIDPEARALTHLAVEPTHSHSGGRLVPIDLVDCVDDEIRLRCNSEEFLSLPVADVTEIVGPGGVRLPSEEAARVFHKEIREIVPSTEVQARPSDPIYATDGPIGFLHGFAVDLADGQLTQVFVSEGLLWGKKLVAVPIGEVTTLDGGIAVKLTRRQVKDLPLVDIRKP
jgi:hypothetical protein